MYYSAQTGGFYSRDIHGISIPPDAVEITVDQHQALLAGQSSGKIISADSSGAPALIDPAAPTPEELTTAARAQRDALLAACDWVVVKAYETGAAVPEAWAAYRQALRDITEQAGFPAEIVWPEVPQ